MGWGLLGYLGWAAGLGLIGYGLLRMGRSSRASGHRSSFGVFEELYHPSAHESHIELLAQEERKTPEPIPGDPPLLPYGGLAAARAARAGRPSRKKRSRLRGLFRRMRG